MSAEDVQALVRYRMGQADEALRAARILVEADMFRQAVGRAYYAGFYAILALLAHRQLGTSKHSGALSLFDREFVRQGCFDLKYSKLLHELFDLRQRADYREMFSVSAERTTSAIVAVSGFLAESRAYLQDEMGL